MMILRERESRGLMHLYRKLNSYNIISYTANGPS